MYCLHSGLRETRTPKKLCRFLALKECVTPRKREPLLRKEAGRKHQVLEVLPRPPLFVPARQKKTTQFMPTSSVRHAKRLRRDCYAPARSTGLTASGYLL